MLETALEVAELLEADGISTTVWDPRVVLPFDQEMLTDARKHQLVVSIEDGLIDGGVGTRLRTELGEAVKVEVCGLPTEHIEHAKPAAIFARFNLTAPDIAKRCVEHLN